MRWRIFLPANAAGGILWAGIYTLASYLAGDALQKADKTINWILGAAAVIAFVAIIVVIRRQFSRLADRAEAAYPGPLDEPAAGPGIVTGATCPAQPAGRIPARRD